MRFLSGVTDQYIYFVAVDSTDLKTRETGLGSFTVYRARNGGSATAYTTPTVAEVSSSNMPGVYSLLLDEDMTIDSGDDSQAVVLHITQASMAPVTLEYELYRAKATAGDTLTLTSGRGNADVTHIATAAVSTTTAQIGVNVVQISTDATAADNAEAFFDGTGYAGTNNVIPTTTTVTNAVSANVTQISGDSTAADNLELAFDETAGAVPWLGIIDQGTAQSASATGVVLRSAAAFADDTLIGAVIAVYGSTQGYWQTRVITDSALSGDTVTVDTWTVTPSGTITYKILASPPASATSVPAVNVTQVGGSTTDVSALATNVAAILVDTGTTLDTKINTIDDFLDTEVAAILAAVDTEVAAILADTNELQTDWANGGRLDLLLDSASSAGDPWSTALPGAYGAGTAGKIIGDNINATISSRASQTSVDTVDGIVDAILVDTAEIGAAGAGLTALATAANLATVDTVVDAIKVKTDSLTFTQAGQVDANIQYVNDVALVGDGSATPWGPA